ncbi:hypothetical protein JXA63_04225 [Candidatus Woesebacteria bacterium]|nr:hypothetical protein [Candidatus Woesebacteria bacterium]
MKEKPKSVGSGTLDAGEKIENDANGNPVFTRKVHRGPTITATIGNETVILPNGEIGDVVDVDITTTTPKK